MRVLRLILLLMPVAVIGACSATFERWVDDGSALPPSVEEYVVRKDDTLYAIAWAHGLDYLRLAEWNSIAAPKYVIYPGQRLRLTSPLAGKQATAAESPAKKAKPAKPRPPPPAASKLGWSWPLANPQRPAAYRRGISVAGGSGQPVLAAADGTVVYSGFGLKRYGGLVIIRHAGDFFSAYGFVTDLKVGKGDKVKRRQQIAALPAYRSKPGLYFDIRHRERRLNPLKYLPAL